MDALGVLLIMFGGAAMIFSIRFRNSNKDAGSGIAVWTIVLAIFYLFLKYDAVMHTVAKLKF